MFLLRRPSTAEIHRFLDHSRGLPLSYSPVGIARHATHAGRLDEQVVVIGHGDLEFQRARTALAAWKHFDIGWVEIFPSQAAIEPGTVVAVLIRHLGFWSLNGSQVLYGLGDTKDRAAFGFAYGTLTNHAESGEELFEVFLDPRSGDVLYRIRAVSWPQCHIAWVGQPIVRLLQARFRRDSAAALERSTLAAVDNHRRPADPARFR